MELKETNNNWDLIVIGGGAAGYFGAIACAEAHPGARVLILEATARVLTKVKISGGGRCNVTHQQFDPKKLITSYPRGQKELIGPFHRFQPADTVTWFANHGVKLVSENDGRMFPSTNNSQTIIDCLEHAAQSANVMLQKNTLVKNILPTTDGFDVKTNSDLLLNTRYILLATGSMPYGVHLAAACGHALVDPVPSLFTFQIKDTLLDGLSGISFPLARVTLTTDGNAKEFVQEGPCLITHWGLSGPAVLKLSAFAARELYHSKYQAKICVNWIFPLKTTQALEQLELHVQHSAKKKLLNVNPFNCTQRFWEAILHKCEIDESIVCCNTTKKQLQKIAQQITQTLFSVTGKGIFKEEFVTAGGVHRDEINFRTMESKVCPGLYLAGEVIDIDGITGGFNFQNAWTGSWLAGNDIARRI